MFGMIECECGCGRLARIEALREAFLAGASWRHEMALASGSWIPSVEDTVREGEAKRRYPLPRTTRPRVVTDPHGGILEWSVSARELLARRVGIDTVWLPTHQYATKLGQSLIPTPARVAMWADLLANPTEECEDES